MLIEIIFFTTLSLVFGYDAYKFIDNNFITHKHTVSGDELVKRYVKMEMNNRYNKNY